MIRILSFRNLPLLALVVAAFCTVAGAAEAGAPKAKDAAEAGDVTWRSGGPGGGGWIQSIAWDPHTPDLLYVGCDVGGFYVSNDGGRSYEIRNEGLRDYFIEAIAVHPKDSQILVLGTQSGVQRTTDGGRHWQWIRNGFPPQDGSHFSAPIGAVCFDPLQPQVVFAGIGRPREDKGGAGAIYRSDDAGLKWRRVDDGQLPPTAIVSDLKFKPGDSKVILAATSEGIFRSDDGGAAWRPSSEGLANRYTEELAFVAAAPMTVYATVRCTAVGAETWNGGIYRSDDAGKTWRSVVGEGYPKIVSKGSGARHLSSNPKELAVDPRDANVVYVGNRDWVSAGLYGTRDGGAHWKRLSRHKTKDDNMDFGWLNLWGAQVESLSISPAAPDRMAFGTSGHVFVSDDAGQSWQQRYSTARTDGRLAGAGLETTCVWRLVADPVRPQRVYVGYMDIGLFISDDGGLTFRRSAEGMKMGGNCFSVVVDPAAPETLWAATGWWEHNEGDVCRSLDDGRTWQVVGRPDTGLPSGQVLEMVLDLHSPVDKRRLFAISVGHGIFTTEDGGTSWHDLNANLPADLLKKPQGLLLDPADSQHLIVALAGELHETRDAGKSWQLLGAPGGLGDVRRLVAAPGDLRTLYAAVRASFDQQAHRAFRGGAFRSDDGGKTWRQLIDTRFASDIAVSFADPQMLYLATKADPYFDNPIAEGVLSSADGGKTWQRENTGLSVQNVKAIATSQLAPSVVYVGSSGNGLFVGQDKRIPAKAK